MKDFTEHLRAIQFTLLSLCFIGLIFALFPNQTTLDKAKDEARIVKILHSNFDVLVKAPFDDKALSDIENTFSEFVAEYLQTTYQVTGTQRYVFSVSAQCSEDDANIFSRKFINSKNCTNKLFAPTAKGVHLDNFITAFDNTLTSLKVSVPTSLDLTQLVIGKTVLNSPLISDVQTLGENTYEGFISSIFNGDNSATIFFNDDYQIGDETEIARLEFIQKTLQQIIPFDELSESDQIERGQILELLTASYANQDTKDLLHEVGNNLQEVLLPFSFGYVMLFESAQKEYKADTVNIVYQESKGQPTKMYLRFTSMDLSHYLCDMYFYGSDSDSSELDCTNELYDDDFIEKVLEQTQFDQVQIAVDSFLNFDKSQKAFIQALDQIGIDSRRYSKIRLGNKFADIFPNLLLVTSGMPKISLANENDELLNLLKSLEPIYAEQFSVFGAQINSYYFGTVIAALIMMVIAYFNVHWSEFTRRYASLKLNDCAPWVGVYTSFIARSLFFITVIILPVITSGVIYFTSQDETFKTVCGVLLLITIVVAGSTLRHILLFWKQH